MKLLQFTAPWCAPCKGMAPMVEKAVQTTGVEFEKIDIEESPELTAKYQIRGVPAFIILSSEGQVLGKKVGSLSLTSLMEFVKNPS
jgi:thiol-disulfide isomerase/thioredoxin